ncbi:testicular acid phosphatase homolog isoform X1 [Stegodyphus dumicola]|uniref:testicular acid phosphatase homolog isoform X1 n=1 Tax=Stegodyphus dumicola TaxID=202533 RepID=UPI0015AA78D1|nr:testicular acid phosphatase homolog isoform X1 [Stegodyphus dumicola]
MTKIFLYATVYLFIYLLKSSEAKEDTKLLFVQILFRHGDRAPINLYPNDPNPESFWLEGLGKLTMLGRKQHYAVGKFFRLLYENFTTSSPLEIDVISSANDRCIKSAETNLASFYAPSSKWQFDKHLKWQPISISYIPKSEDKYLETESYCPRASVEEENVVNSPGGQAFIAKHKEMFENLTYYSGTSITDWLSASYFHDTIFIEKKYNLTVPSWVEPFWDELETVADLSFFWTFNSPLLHRLRAGPLLQKIIEKMNLKLSGDIPDQKVQIYSAHDTNIAVVLAALNLFNMKQPPYCSSLLFELYEKNGKNVIRLLYLNSTNPEKEMQTPHVLKIEGCSEFCPLDYFISYTKNLIPGDWEQECELDKSFIEKVKEKNITIALFVAMIGVTIIVMTVYAVWRFHIRKDKYSYHLMPMS